MKKTLAGAGALLLLPALTVAGFAFALARPEAVAPGLGRALAAAGLACGGYAVVLVLLAWLAERGRRRLRREAGDLRLREAELLRQMSDLRARVDTLSAAREVCLIVNQDVEFRAILEKVLGITADLLGAKGAEEISIWLRAEDNGPLVPRARRRAGVAAFEADDAPAPPLAASAFEHGRLITATGDTHLEVALPLVADREIFGVLLARAPLDGDRDEKAERAQRAAAHLEEFSKFVSLAIKTPDLYTRAVEDSLTKLATKRHFRHQLDLHVRLARRHGEPLALIMMDIDHFKRINDTYGHPTGDAVLRGVAEIVLRNLRSTDAAAYSAYRYGGEEMSVILPKTSLARAEEVAERLRRQVGSAPLAGAGGEPVPVTLSAGVAGLGPAMETLDALIAAADRALYEAKEGGRNRVRVASPAAAPRPDRTPLPARA